MTSTEASSSSQYVDEKAYNRAWTAYRDAHHVDYQTALATCRREHAVIQAEIDHDRPWSDVADTARWLYGEAIADLQQLDREAHDAGMAASVAAMALSEIASSEGSVG